LIIRSPCTSSTRDDANPPMSACRTFAGSAPIFDANSSASATASMLSATMIWFATLHVCPAPTSPTSVTFFPMRSNSGFTRSNACRVPPHMMVRLAALAPTWPPDTGASTYAHSSARIRSANAFVSTGEMELMSTTTLPALSPSATPLGPNSTAATSGVSGTIVMTTSARSATSLPLAHAVPPASVSADGTPERLCRNSSWPPLMRCSAMGAPMIPRPMKPTLAIAV
jgi:hypothetical protein